MKSLILILCISCFHSSCLNQNIKYQISDREKAVNKQMAYSAKILSEKYQMHPCATSVAMPEGDIQYLELQFDIIGPLSQKNIRKVLIDSVYDLLNNINNDKELCSYLKNACLDISEVGIGLFFFDSKRYPINQPDIGMASIRKATVRYFRCDPDDISINGMQETKESYQTALSILHNECTAVQKRCTEPKEPEKSDKNQ